ncbi:MAG: N-acetylglucosamine-6-phosphate deacetylase [Gammaproteobacteria bacterium]|nr:N-acetylglucosamine-6-phosphate deacetylase [Gammaproteobacteria bacterium]
MMQSLQIKGPRIHTEDVALLATSIFIEKQKISIISEGKEKKLSAAKVLELPSNWHVLPGFIDIHIHGAAGSDILDTDTSNLTNISTALVKEGVTSFLPTTMTVETAIIDKALAIIFAYKQKQNTQKIVGAEIVGINLEGPFISAKKAGAQQITRCLIPDINLFKHWQNLAPGLIKIVSIAPELENAIPFMQYLYSQNICAAFAHSDADYEIGLKAIAVHLNHVTHIFNAMRGINHREPNAITALLLDDAVTIELIADGIHIHPAVLKLVLKIKGAERVILISDAMRAKGLGDGEFELGGQKVFVKNGAAKLPNGTLAGSILTMDQALRNIIKYTNCTLGEAIKMVSENPAKKLKIFDRKGSIAIGKDADLTVLNENLEVMLTICRGEIVFDKTISSRI